MNYTILRHANTQAIVEAGGLIHSSKRPGTHKGHIVDLSCKLVFVTDVLSPTVAAIVTECCRVGWLAKLYC